MKHGDGIKRNFQGVWIPAAIWLDTSLSINEKVMLVEINSLESQDRGCYAGNDHFSEFFNLSKSRVSEIISALVAKDLVRIDFIRKGKQMVERQIWMTENGRLLTGGESLLRKRRRTPFGKGDEPPSEKAMNPFGKGDEPPSEKAKESNTVFNNTLSNTVSSPEESGEPSPSPDTKLQAACRDTWKSYSDAYFARYGVEPLRNAASNTAIKAFCKRIPHREAPEIAAFFVRHNDKWYVQKTHPVTLLAKDAEGLRTQWATGRTMTGGKAGELERTSGNLDSINDAIQIIRSRGNASV